MKPFIFQFKETAIDEGFDYTKIRYDNELNLNVEITSGRPAIQSLNLVTETFTKADYESSDSDNNFMKAMLETETRTFTRSEASDSDNDRNNFSDIMLATSTHTRTGQEISDSDPI